ncbi:BnaA09g10430D [Brassica napus]|uniref:(rape) hypothetical protein n=1 Tax=Brassica napus TaxID=3708 RepID=A0A078HQ82_BRANA|nr:unnamed protein product [Brassica napus]CDY39791.1 BnaA09g10430D [Brassica napus]
MYSMKNEKTKLDFISFVLLEQSNAGASYPAVKLNQTWCVRFFYLSLLILTLVAYFTAADGKEGWIPDDLDKGHLDYFFWLLVVLGLVNIPVHVFFSVKYTQKKAAV